MSQYPEFPVRPSILYAKIISETQWHYMTKPVLTIGRSSNKSSEISSESSVWLPARDRSVSRAHATIALNVDLQGFELFVHGKNGMEVNGTVVRPNGVPVQLRSQDILQAGSCTLWFLLPCSKGDGPRKKKRLYGPDLQQRTLLGTQQGELTEHRGRLAESKVSQRLMTDLPVFLGELLASAEKHRMRYETILDRVFEMHPNVNDHMWIKSAVRHVLSLNDFFETVRDGEVATWTLKRQHLPRFLRASNVDSIKRGSPHELIEKRVTNEGSEIS
ncbi:hypothetical protein CCYA_CCYA13G3620 [Cyanidiococcus yangmingshanensis]|nr:hypothetical protein CCYA_CCYA13G3620 [Cyanidiococcus yangmingshanensis]